MFAGNSVNVWWRIQWKFSGESGEFSEGFGGKLSVCRDIQWQFGGDTLWLSVSLRPQNRRLIRDGSPGRPPRLSHSSWALMIPTLCLCLSLSLSLCLSVCLSVCLSPYTSFQQWFRYQPKTNLQNQRYGSIVSITKPETGYVWDSIMVSLTKHSDRARVVFMIKPDTG